MCRNSMLIIFLFVATSLACGQASMQSVATGVIAGTVLSQEGQVVDHSQVCTQSTSGSRTEINCRGVTDKDGRFQIDNVKFGTYGVFAMKVEEGYTVENQSPGQRVRITGDHPWADVTIRLRLGGGILIGSVRDKTNGHPVKEFQAHYLVIDGKCGGGGGGSRSANGEFRMPVPSGCDLVVALSARGYKGWVYTDLSDPSRPVLRMSSGERKQLNIDLERVSHASDQPSSADGSQSIEQPK